MNEEQRFRRWMVRITAECLRERALMLPGYLGALAATHRHVEELREARRRQLEPARRVTH